MLLFCASLDRGFKKGSGSPDGNGGVWFLLVLLALFVTALFVG